MGRGLDSYVRVRVQHFVSVATGINDAGEIVGGYNADDIFETRYALPFDINDLNQFVGEGVTVEEGLSDSTGDSPTALSRS